MKALKERLLTAYNNIRFIFKAQMKVRPTMYLCSFLLGLIRCGFMLITVLMPKVVVECFSDPQKEGRMMLVIACFAIALAVLTYADRVLTRVLEKEGYYLPHHMLLQLARKMTRIDYKDVDSKKFNEAYTCAENAVFKLTSKGDEAIRLLFSSMIEIIAIVAVIATLDWGALLLLVVASVAQIMLDSRINRENNIFRKNIAPEMHGMNYPMCVLEGYFPGIKDIITFDGQSLFTGKMGKAAERADRKYTANQFHAAFIRFFQYLIRGAETAAVYFILAYRFETGSLTAGLLIMYITAAGQFKGILNTVLAGWLSIEETQTYMSQYREVMDSPEKNFCGGATRQNHMPSRPEIEFSHVSFRYGDGESLALDDVSFKISYGQKLVIVGENGAGKTTLIKLLLRLYDTYSGSICINGTDIRDMGIEEYWDSITAVFQDYQLFDCSLSENIGFLDCKQDRIREILHELGADTFADRPDMLINSAGGSASIGERQTIAIARALYKGGLINIFDEVTSSIDPLREASIYDAIQKRSGENTLIYISHRLAVCKDSDRILLMDHGKVKEYGTHARLMEDDREYARLYRMQSEKYR